MTTSPNMTVSTRFDSGYSVGSGQVVGGIRAASLARAD